MRWKAKLSIIIIITVIIATIVIIIFTITNVTMKSILSSNM